MSETSGSWRNRSQAAPAATPKKASWRKKDQPGGDGRRPGRWTERAERDIRRPQYQHRIRLGLLCVLLLALTAVLILVIFRTHKTTPFIAMVVSRYEAPLAPNAFALEDAEHLAERFRVGKGLRARKNLTFAGNLKRDITRENYWSYLSELIGSEQSEAPEPGGPDRDMFVFYISAHGVVDDEGRACLLLQDAAPLDSSTWLPVSELLKKISTHEHFVGEDGGRVKKLVILDSGRLLEDWRMGLLYNGFADALQAAVDETNDSTLVVLNASSPGEMAWSAPELQGSVFAHFLGSGLSGYADADSDGEVTLAELLEYTDHKVSRWARERRDAAQHPFLVSRQRQAGDWNNWRLAYASVSPDTPPGAEVAQRLEAARSQAEQRGQTVAQLWEQRQELLQAADSGSLPPYTLDPLGWAELQRTLLGMERCLLAGKAYDARFDDLHDEALRLLRDFGRGQSMLGDRVCSLPLLTQVSGEPSGGHSERDYQQWKKQPQAAQWTRPLTYVEAASLAWRWLLEGPCDQAQRAEALRLVGKAGSPPVPPPIEMHYLSMLQAHLDDGDAERIRRSLQTRDMAERLAAPRDERVFHWIRSLVDRGDVSRRLAEDKLFVHSSQSLNEADELWEQLLDDTNGPYRQADESARVVAKALRLRDQSWAEAPYLAEWLGMNLRAGKPIQGAWEHFLTLIEDTQQLGLLLDRWSNGVQANDVNEIDTLSARVNGTLDDLHSQYLAQLAAARSAGLDQHTLHDIYWLLQVPVLGGSEQRAVVVRNDLRDTFLNEIFNGARSATDDRPSSDVPDRSSGDELAADARYLQLMTARTPHPMLQMLDRIKLDIGEQARVAEQHRPVDPAKERDAEQLRSKQLQLLASQGAEVRQLLADIPSARSKLETLARQRMQQQPRDVAEARRPLSAADQLVRAAAATLGQRPWFGATDDPSYLLRMFDRHYQLQWHAERATDDFWGPAASGAPPYFVDAAEAYQASSRRMFREDDPRLDERLAQRVAAAAPSAGVQPQADDVRFLQDEPTRAQQVHIAAGPGLPPGEATVFMRTYQGTQRMEVFPATNANSPIRSTAVPISEDASAFDWQVQLAKGDIESTTLLQAVSLYRGHVRTEDFYVSPARPGVEVLVGRRDYPAPQVTVHGDAVRPGMVLFVFDCSGSMGTRLLVERKEERRLDIARAAMSTILRQLPDNRYRVGLMVYGHRTGFADMAGRIVRKGANAPAHPNADVEMVLEPKFLLDDGTRQRIAGALSGLEPLGQTPLYYALYRALPSFVGRQDVSTKRIVVLTDGVNQTVNSGPAEVNKSAAEILSMLDQPRYSDVQIDIIGFGMEDLKSTDRTSVDALKRIASKSGGSYNDEASDPVTLVRALQKALKPAEFAVTRPTAIPSVFSPLEKTWVVEPWQQQKADYDILLRAGEATVAPHRVVLEGGESLELIYDEARRVLVHERYAPQHRQPVAAEPTDPNYYVSAFMPARDAGGSGVEFYVSVQNSDPRRFSPRPQRVWAEITPINYRAATAEVPVYHFYDLDFEPYQPVPVLRFRVPSWPDEAQDARLRIWFHPEDVEPVVVDPSRAGGDWFSVQGIDDIQLKVERRDVAGGGVQWVVKERHPSSASDLQALASLRVQMQPPPDQIVHSYVKDAQQVEHTFKYHVSSVAPRIELTPRSKILQGAVTVKEPIEVRPEKRF